MRELLRVEAIHQSAQGGGGDDVEGIAGEKRPGDVRQRPAAERKDRIIHGIDGDLGPLDGLAPVGDEHGAGDFFPRFVGRLIDLRVDAQFLRGVGNLERAEPEHLARDLVAAARSQEIDGGIGIRQKALLRRDVDVGGIAREFDRARVEYAVRLDRDPGDSARRREDVESGVLSENDRIFRSGDRERLLVADGEFRFARSGHDLLVADLDATRDRARHKHVASGFLRGKIHRARGGNVLCGDTDEVVEIPVAVNKRGDLFFCGLGFDEEEDDRHFCGNRRAVNAREGAEFEANGIFRTPPVRFDAEHNVVHLDVVGHAAGDRLSVRAGDIDLPGDRAISAVAGVGEWLLRGEGCLAVAVQRCLALDDRFIHRFFDGLGIQVHRGEAVAVHVRVGIAGVVAEPCGFPFDTAPDIWGPMKIPRGNFNHRLGGFGGVFLFATDRERRVAEFLDPEIRGSPRVCHAEFCADAIVAEVAALGHHPSRVPSAGRRDFRRARGEDVILPFLRDFPRNDLAFRHGEHAVLLGADKSFDLQFLARSVKRAVGEDAAEDGRLRRDVGGAGRELTVGVRGPERRLAVVRRLKKRGGGRGGAREVDEARGIADRRSDLQQLSRQELDADALDRLAVAHLRDAHGEGIRAEFLREGEIAEPDERAVRDLRVVGCARGGFKNIRACEIGLPLDLAEFLLVVCHRRKFPAADDFERLVIDEERASVVHPGP